MNVNEYNKDCSSYSFRDNPPKALEHYHQWGFHIEKEVFSSEESQVLIEKGLALKEAEEKGYRPAMMPHGKEKAFLQAMQKPNIVSIMKQLVKGEVVGLQSEFFYCQPGTRGFSLHQDNFFVQAPEDAFASAWGALTDTYTEKGGLIVYPGSHKEGALPVATLQIEKAAGQDPNANNEATVVPSHYKPLNVTVPKGAVLFIHSCLVHGSNTNSTNEWRYVLLNTYIRRGEPFRPGRYAKRKAVEVE